jgi:hypothetical protein
MGAQDDYVRTQIRFPPELYRALKEKQKKSGRSFNAEIIARLEASFGAEEKEAKLLENFGPKVTSIEQLAADMAELRRLVEEKLGK